MNSDFMDSEFRITCNYVEFDFAKCLCLQCPRGRALDCFSFSFWGSVHVPLLFSSLPQTPFCFCHDEVLGKGNHVLQFQFPSKVWKSCSFSLIPSALSWLREAPALCCARCDCALFWRRPHPGAHIPGLLPILPARSVVLPVTVRCIYWLQVCFCIFTGRGSVISFLYVFCLTHR